MEAAETGVRIRAISESGHIRVGLLSDPAGLALLRRCAKLSGVSFATAKREFRKFAEGTDGDDESRVLSVDAGDLLPGMDIATAVACQLSETIGLGKFGQMKRLADRAARPHKEKRVSTKQHPYVRGDKGRSWKGEIATMTCRCGAAHDIHFRQLCNADQMDRKFIQAGWRISPAVCPKCQPQRETKMTTTPTPGAIAAQAKMFGLLQLHFDADKGLYATDWSDAAVAKAAGVSTAMVSGVRGEAFGPLKEPEDIAALARDIATLDEMVVEAARSVETIKQELVGAKARLADLRSRFAA